LSLSADFPFLHSPSTPLETNHAAFLIAMAHQADFVASLRELDTGIAKDVSGVLRVTMGDGEGRKDLEETEMLYFVARDGGVKVFERGQ
jgi:elongator complex protein 6